MKAGLLACIAASFCLPAWPQLPGLRDAVRIGPATGSAAPDFNLPDHLGQRRSLQSLMGPQGLVLVFFRSADW